MLGSSLSLVSGAFPFGLSLLETLVLGSSVSLWLGLSLATLFLISLLCPPLWPLVSPSSFLWVSFGSLFLLFWPLFVSFGALLPCLGPSWALLGLSWALLGLSWCSLGLSWASLWLSWCPLGLSWASLGLSWAALGGLLGTLGLLLGLPFWAPRAKKRQGSNKVPQDRPKSRPRGPRGCQNGPPKTDFFVYFSGSVFGPPLGLPFGGFLGRLAPQKLRFCLGGPSKTLLPPTRPQERKKPEKVTKMTPGIGQKTVKKGIKKWTRKKLPRSREKGPAT